MPIPHPGRAVPVSVPRIAGAAAAVALLALAGTAVYRRMAAPRQGRQPERPPAGVPRIPPAAVSGRIRAQRQAAPATEAAARRLQSGAAVLSFSVLADSSLEHYRGTWHNPAMYMAPAMAAVTLGASTFGALRPGSGMVRSAVCGAALATGAAGTGFHIYNVGKRDGGFRLLNLFYGAPLGAPFALALAGLFGLAAEQLHRESSSGGRPRLLGLDACRPIAALTVFGLLGTVAEAALLHFRGAFHDPFMFAPVTLPPIAGAALAVAALQPANGTRRAADILLKATMALGAGGTGFHAYGIHRNMGGWRNWSQNILQGPPLPAPPSFTGVALAGLASLKLLEGAAA